MQNEKTIWQLVDQKGHIFETLSDRVWDVPETNFQEVFSCALHRKTLLEQGFRVKECAGGLKTAVMGESGKGGPVIAFLGEFDALPNLSQQANVFHAAPVIPDGNGHGCGHNLLGAGALAAATAVKDWLEQTGTPGTVRYYGCPAEEGGAGKVFMIRNGAFESVDCAISWHPFAFTTVCPPSSLANVCIDFVFTGRSSHAAMSPHLGRSALDAAELMNVGVNYLREHMLPTSRIHYAYINAGGKAANVVQSETRIRYMIRAEKLEDLFPLQKRVENIAHGAALMTETQVNIQVLSGMANLTPAPKLEKLLQHNIEELGPLQLSSTDYQYAQDIQATIPQTDIVSAYSMMEIPYQENVSIFNEVIPYRPYFTKNILGSTDIGDVSWIVPTVQLLATTMAVGTSLHSWQATAQGKSSLAHKGMLHAAKIMAATAINILENPHIIQNESQNIKNKNYKCVIPPTVMPPDSAKLV
ncbi:MAG: amidohydrolase [Acetobacter orientalis]|uniref:Amidohydrolase n=1 Tax=Acetobacter orientalis TaxID=146474 RepID=A0A2Z5ZI12_9PROT|nr:amidohydrolase [Acetobacter orientalis]BBC80009.1 amidohydrolase [Acetobacter orientalis]GAN66144.1 amidohydrolase/aminobenzoyl-glutamate utilization protein [Acetobacter orientalis]GEL62613.1 peptidase M20 [Acetobacter orientalis]